MKQSIRKRMLDLRQQMPLEQSLEYSRRISKRFLGLDMFKNSINIMVYIAFKNEVRTIPLINSCLSRGKRIVVPLCVKESRQLLLSELKDPETELRPGTYGVPEPTPEYLRPFSRENLDLILVPGVAFDKQGFRLGYGAGYYDRFFNELTHKVTSIGLAFELQIVQEVPVEPTDWPVDFVITEKRLINCISEKEPRAPDDGLNKRV